MEEHFSGSFQSLFNYWNNAERARKFKSGGTRTLAVEYFIKRVEPDIHKGVWIDTAIGAGYVQQRVDPSVSPIMIVGMDFSLPMLKLIENQEIQKVAASAFSPPFRDRAASLVTSLFCLSDYPHPKPVFDQMHRISSPTGMIVYMDYSREDEYWKKRKEMHGKKGKDGKKITGNIYLRTPEEIEEMISSQLRIVKSGAISYPVKSQALNPQFDLPETIHREFIYIEIYHPRSN